MPKTMNHNETMQNPITREEAVRLAFEKQNETMKRLNEMGATAYVASLENLSDAFRLEEKCLHCIDERTPGGLHSAGSGILRPREDVVRSFRQTGVTEVTSHDGCGAAVLYCRREGIDESLAPEEAKKWAKEIAEELGVPYKHIGFEEMSGPADFHFARTSYYDATAKFNVIPGLPEGFVISRGIQKKEDSLAELGVSLNIAFNPRNFGDLFTEENPFVIVAIGKTPEDLEAMKTEISELAHEYGEKVRVDGFVAPEEKE